MSGMNKINMGMSLAPTSLNSSMMLNGSNGLLGNNGSTSPRQSSQQNALVLAKKYRASSRQASSSHRSNRRNMNKYENNLNNTVDTSTAMNQKPLLGALPNGYGSSNHNDSSSGNSGMFPQINPSHQSNHNSNSNSSNSNYPIPRSAHKKSHNPYEQQQQNNNPNAHPHLNHNHAAAVPSPSHVKDHYSGVVTEDHHLAGVTSLKGLKPGNPNWINQDNFFIMENFDAKGDTRIYCVLDGHGEHGHLVSRRARENFPHFLLSNNLRIEASFNMMHNDLTSSEIDCRCSGATCVLALITNGKLTVYNCGDSRGVLGRRAGNGTITAMPMSNDHKPDKPEERKRILNAGGHLGCRQVLVNQGNRGPVSMPVGPCRVWYQHRGETLGLAMSRSLGDAIVHKFGVASEPEAIEHVLDDMDEFVILATDGVWDVVDNNHAVQMVHNFSVRSPNWNPLEASSVICKFARSRWEKLSPMIDDITCIVIKLPR
jgi:serine/threonine protein phosphatase PrpC